VELPEVIACACATGSDVTGNHMTGSDVSHMPGSGPVRKPLCACATGNCAISALVGPFDWK